MDQQEIFEKLMKFRDESIRGDDKMLDEYFDAIMYSVAKVLDLSDAQAAALAGDLPTNEKTAAVVTPSIVLDSAQFEITDGFVGRMGVDYKTATEVTLSAAIEGAAKRNNKSVSEIVDYLVGGGAVAWCDSPNHYYDHGQGVIRPKRAAKPIQLVRCDCGHSVPRSQVMSASQGSSCPDCYDRMSD